MVPSGFQWRVVLLGHWHEVLSVRAWLLIFRCRDVRCEKNNCVLLMSGVLHFAKVWHMFA